MYLCCADELADADDALDGLFWDSRAKARAQATARAARSDLSCGRLWLWLCVRATLLEACWLWPLVFREERELEECLLLRLGDEVCCEAAHVRASLPAGIVVLAGAGMVTATDWLAELLLLLLL
jgi:hypothetical protein